MLLIQVMWAVLNVLYWPALSKGQKSGRGLHVDDDAASIKALYFTNFYVVCPNLPTSANNNKAYTKWIDSTDVIEAIYSTQCWNKINILIILSETIDDIRWLSDDIIWLSSMRIWEWIWVIKSKTLLIKEIDALQYETLMLSLCSINWIVTLCKGPGDALCALFCPCTENHATNHRIIAA